MNTRSSPKKRSLDSQDKSLPHPKKAKSQHQSEVSLSDDLPSKDKNAKATHPPEKEIDMEKLPRTSSPAASLEPPKLTREGQRVAPKADESSIVLTGRPKLTDCDAALTPREKPRDEEPIRIVTTPQKIGESETTKVQTKVSSKEKRASKRSLRFHIVSPRFFFMVGLSFLFSEKIQNLPKPDCLFGVLLCTNNQEVVENISHEHNSTFGEDGEYMIHPNTNVLSSEILVSKEASAINVPLYEEKSISAIKIREPTEKENVGALSKLMADKPDWIKDLQQELRSNAKYFQSYLNLVAQYSLPPLPIEVDYPVVILFLGIIHVITEWFGFFQ